MPARLRRRVRARHRCGPPDADRRRGRRSSSRGRSRCRSRSGRPELRIVTHGIETIVLIPLVLVFGSIWDATGAAAAVLDLDHASSRSRGWSRSRGSTGSTRATEAVVVVKVLVVSGIWPPDVGGPASHAPELADFLRGRGHEVRGGHDRRCAARPAGIPGATGSRGATGPACATSSGRGARAPGGRGKPTSSTRRGCSGAARRLAARGHAARGQADRRPGLRARAAARPDRGFRSTTSSAPATRASPGLQARARPRPCGRRAPLRRPERLARRASPATGGSVRGVGSTCCRTRSPCPHARRPRRAAPTSRLRRADARLRRPLSLRRRRSTSRSGARRRRGRRARGRGRRARARAARRARRRARARRPRALPRRAAARAVLELLRRRRRRGCSRRAGRTSRTSLVEGLAVGTPVIATAAGGVARGRHDGENGLLVPPGDAGALAAAIRRFFADGALRERLRAAAAGSVGRFAPERVYGRLEALLPGGGRVKPPRLLIVGRTRYRLPLSESLRAEVRRARRAARPSRARQRGRRRAERDALSSWRAVSAAGSTGRCLRSGCRSATRRELRRFAARRGARPGCARDGSSCSGARCSRARDAPVILDVHGDWRTSTRLYGSPARKLLNPIADRVAVSALRQADAVRTISDYTTGLVRELRRRAGGASSRRSWTSTRSSGRRRRCPRRRAPLFVGVLEHYKGIDELADAWRDRRARRCPTRRCTSSARARAGRSSRGSCATCPAASEWTEPLPTGGRRARARRGDARSSFRRASEGMGRVLVEAFCRGRPVVGLARRRDRRPRPRRRERAARRAAGPAGAGRRARPRALRRGAGRAPGGRRRRQRGRPGWPRRRSTRRAWRRWSRGLR